MVTLKVGKNKKAFAVHKKLLCEKIPYFEKMFQGLWIEASGNIATFPEDEVECFDVLIGWLYSGALRLVTEIVSSILLTKIGETARVAQSDKQINNNVLEYTSGILPGRQVVPLRLTRRAP